MVFHGFFMGFHAVLGFKGAVAGGFCAGGELFQGGHRVLGGQGA